MKTTGQDNRLEDGTQPPTDEELSMGAARGHRTFSNVRHGGA